MKEQLSQAIFAWLGEQGDSYLLNRQNFLSTAGPQYRIFNGHVLVSDKVFNASRFPWQPLNASVEIPIQLGSDKLLLTFNLFQVVAVPENFLVLAADGTEASYKYLKYQNLVNDLKRMENSSDEAMLVHSVVKHENGGSLSKRDAIIELANLKNWLVNQSIRV